MNEPKRMTDEEFDKEIGRREAESPFKALLFASREANRARASEAEKDKTIQGQRDMANPAIEGSHDQRCPARPVNVSGWAYRGARRESLGAREGDMARAEDAAIQAQRKVSGLIQAFDPERTHKGNPGLRPSAGFLERYVEHLIEQVGVMS